MIKRLSGFVAIVISCAIAFSTMDARANEFIAEPLDYDFPYEIEQAALDGKNLVVMFHKNGCPYCDKMKDRVFPHPAVSKFYNEKFVMIIVNSDGDLDVTLPGGETMAEKEYAAKSLVRATPVFLYYAKDGGNALRLTGYQDPYMFVSAGKYIADGAFKDGTSFLNYMRNAN